MKFNIKDIRAIQERKNEVEYQVASNKTDELHKLFCELAEENASSISAVVDLRLKRLDVKVKFSKLKLNLTSERDITTLEELHVLSVKYNDLNKKVEILEQLIKDNTAKIESTRAEMRKAQEIVDAYFDNYIAQLKKI